MRPSDRQTAVLPEPGGEQNSGSAVWYARSDSFSDGSRNSLSSNSKSSMLIDSFKIQTIA